MIAETAAWLDLLYSQCSREDGQLAVVSDKRNRLIGLFEIGSGAALVAAAKAMQQHPGCYLKINPMDGEAIERRMRLTGRGAVGDRSEVKTLVGFYLDVDAGKPGYPSRSTALWALEQMPRRPTLVINSGGESGGFHVYWLLRQPVRLADCRDDVQRQARRWQERLKQLVGGRLDSTANLDRVLRCVGVPRRDGKQVSCHQYTPDRLFDLDELDYRE